MHTVHNMPMYGHQAQ